MKWRKQYIWRPMPYKVQVKPEKTSENNPTFMLQGLMGSTQKLMDMIRIDRMLWDRHKARFRQRG